MLFIKSCVFYSVKVLNISILNMVSVSNLYYKVKYL